MAKNLEPLTRRQGLAAALLGTALAAAAQAPPEPPPPLTVCMAQDNAPLSHAVAGQPQGLDVLIAQAAAQRLGRPLKVVLFESDFEKESTLGHEVNALLSAGVCEAASGFPLLAGDLGPPQRAQARTPDYPGAKRKRDRPFVPLGTLVATRAYQGVAMGLVQRRPAAGQEALAGLAGVAQDKSVRLGVVSGTMAGAMAMMWRHGSLKAQLVSLGQREAPFELLAEQPAPRVDALLVPLALWDGWRVTHPATPLVASGWQRPLGINLGFVTLAPAAELRAAFDAVIGQARTDGTLARWAAQAGVSWVPPGMPEVSVAPGLAALAGD